MLTTNLEVVLLAFTHTLLVTLSHMTLDDKKEGGILYMPGGRGKWIFSG